MEQSEKSIEKCLNHFRPVLLTLAEAMISSTLRGDLEASDLVQQTLLEAHCNVMAESASLESFSFRGSDTCCGCWMSPNSGLNS